MELMEHIVEGKCQIQSPADLGRLGIGDGVHHWFGCLRADAENRATFLSDLEASGSNPKLVTTIKREKLRIDRLHAAFRKEGNTTERGRLLTSFKREWVTWANSKANLRHLVPGRTSTAEDPAAQNASDEANKSSGDTQEDKVYLNDIDANVIYFKNKHPYDKPEFLPTTFPNQKIPLPRLLRKDPVNNPISWKCEKDMIRYFHVPSNNMAWLEDVIARYYNEDTPKLDSPYTKPRKGEYESKTRMLLRPQYWRGLQHGNSPTLPIHTRHMRPRCFPISTDPRKTILKPRNLAIFMPYLHWETDRKRHQAAAAIRNTAHPPWAALEDTIEAKPWKRFNHKSMIGAEHDTDTSIKKISRSKSSLSVMEKISWKTPTPKDTSHLGRLLLHAAALVEALDAYTEEKTIEDYLVGKAPMHPRRTLDQAYYWTLKDTRKRDRDQVVYRGTAPIPRFMHHKCFKMPNAESDKLKEECTRCTKPKGCAACESTCRQCKDDVRKVPRVVMVDQLWMWVLDDNTIITSFPERWGRNKPDYSAVHKCIRTRLRAARDDEVRSVYDLATLIIDECCRVFFDRTRSLDLQPQVMDNFANAIGKVSHKQTIAFDHFWEYTRLTSKQYTAQQDGEPETRFVQKMQKSLLDVNPEGELFREMKDIMDELSIMTQLKTQEKSVVHTFTKHVKNLITPPCPVGWTSTKSAGSGPNQDVGQGSASGIPESISSDDVDWTMSCATDLEDSIDRQLKELGYLRDAAENTSQALKDLLGLKQQQAGVVEAREAVKQGEETLRQGRSIMLFTIVTIIFLPLAFFTGIFGMNATELTGQSGDYNFANIFVYMIPISFVVITTSLFLAFSKFVRALISFAFHYALAWFLTQTPIYVRWHQRHLNSKSLKEKEVIITNRMKANALRDFERQRQDREMEDERREKKALERDASPDEDETGDGGRARAMVWSPLVRRWKKKSEANGHAGIEMSGVAGRSVNGAAASSRP